MGKQAQSSLVGKWVEVHAQDGVHYGILQEVRDNGILVAVPAQRNASLEQLKVGHADKPTNLTVEQTQFGSPFFSPFFFRPFFVRPFFFRPFINPFFNPFFGFPVRRRFF